MTTLCRSLLGLLGSFGLMAFATGCGHAADNYHPRGVSQFVSSNATYPDPAGSAMIWGGIAATAATVEASKDPSERRVLGWGFRDDGSYARWWSCDGPRLCGSEARTAPSTAVRGFHVVERTRPQLADQSLGDEVDVVEIRLHDTPAPPLSLPTAR